MNTRNALKTFFLCTGILLACAAFNADAQQAGAMPHMSMPHSPEAASTASTQAFKTGEEQMMTGMSAPAYTGDADKDFVSHMIPHHRGAVTMARIELKYGKDPAIRKLARDIIQAQNKEIAFMKKWQSQRAKP
jgi:uncharacterized protein (DUF305 family)